MGVRVIQSNDRAAMFCSTSGVCFGPAIWASSDEAAETFIRFAMWSLGVSDVRRAEDDDLFGAAVEWSNLDLGEKYWLGRDEDDFDTCPFARLARLRMHAKKKGEA